MSVMNFREPNQVKWVGVRPAHNGTQVIKHTNAQNGTVIIYTVPSGNTYFLTGFTIGVRQEAAGDIALGVRDGSDVWQYYLFHNSYGSAQPPYAFGMGLTYPIEIPEDYDIYLWSSAASVYIFATIMGWIE